MRTKTIYICEFCGSEHKTSMDAFLCEATCLGLTSEQYQEYNDLLKKERHVFGVVACTNNPETRKACDDVVAEVIAFQKKYGFKDNR